MRIGQYMPIDNFIVYKHEKISLSYTGINLTNFIKVDHSVHLGMIIMVIFMMVCRLNEAHETSGLGLTTYSRL